MERVTEYERIGSCTVVDFRDSSFVTVIQALELKTSPEGVCEMPRYAALAVVVPSFRSTTRSWRTLTTAPPGESLRVDEARGEALTHLFSHSGKWIDTTAFQVWHRLKCSSHKVLQDNLVSTLSIADRRWTDMWTMETACRGIT
eukprot:s574_g30.t1